MRETKVPPTKQSTVAAFIARQKADGLGENEGTLIVVNLLQSAVAVPDFTAPDDLIWVVRVVGVDSVLQEGWVSSTTGKARNGCCRRGRPTRRLSRRKRSNSCFIAAGPWKKK